MRAALFLAVLTQGTWAAAQCLAGLEDGKVQTSRPISLNPAAERICLQQLAGALAALPRLAQVTVSARVPDPERVGGQALEAAKEAAALLTQAGVPTVYAVAPRAEADEKPALSLSYFQRPDVAPVARLELREGAVRLGKDSPLPREAATVLTEADRVFTGLDGQALVRLGEGGVVRVYPDSELRVESGTDGGTAELVGGSVEVEAATGFQVRADGSWVQVREPAVFRFFRVNGTTRAEVVSGKVSLQAGGAQVEIPAWHSAQVAADGKPERVRHALPPPVVKGPVQGAHAPPVRAQWAAVPGAGSYLLEAARSPDFAQGLRSALATGLEGVLPLPQGEEPSGSYFRAGAESRTLAPPASLEKWYFRVRAVDADGFWGLPSKVYAVQKPPAAKPAAAP